jgi:hypothetical protein
MRRVEQRRTASNSVEQRRTASNSVEQRRTASNSVEQRRTASNSDFLFFGDSLIEFALVPQVFDERSQKRSYNLALPAGSPEASYFLLRQALDAGAQLSGVIVDFSPFQLDPPAYS